jgi:iron complex transport system substrate-binding protein
VKKLFAVIALLLLSGCASPATKNSQSISQESVTSVSIVNTTTFSVERVVSLANGVAEIINALNAKSILVGRDVSSTEAALQDIPIVTSGHQVIPEKVLALQPDLVIIDASTGPAAAIKQIKSAGVKVIQTPESWTLADIAVKVQAVAAAIGAPAQGELLIQKLQSQSVASKVSGKPKIAFLYLRGTSSIYLIGGPGSGADSLIQGIGAVGMNPDVLLVMTKGLESVGGVDGLIKLPGVAQTTAGKNRAVIDVDDSLLLSFGPRTPSLLNQLAAAVGKVIP